MIEEMERTIRIRDEKGQVVPLKANQVQSAFEQKAGQKNIVLKSRQMGFTTWAVARQVLFLTKNPESVAVGIFSNEVTKAYVCSMVRRMIGQESAWMNPDTMKNGSQYIPLTPRCKWRSRIFAGSILASELDYWDSARILEDVRHSSVSRHDEIVESTPKLDSIFMRDEWFSAEDRGFVRHLFPWWMKPNYCRDPVPVESLTKEEYRLMKDYGLSLGQIGFRRRYTGRAKLLENLHDYRCQYLEDIPWDRPRGAIAPRS